MLDQFLLILRLWGPDSVSGCKCIQHCYNYSESQFKFDNNQTRDSSFSNFTSNFPFRYELAFVLESCTRNSYVLSFFSLKCWNKKFKCFLLAYTEVLHVSKHNWYLVLFLLMYGRQLRFSKACGEVEYNVKYENKRTQHFHINKIHEACIWFQLFFFSTLRRAFTEASNLSFQTFISSYI